MLLSARHALSCETLFTLGLPKIYAPASILQSLPDTGIRSGGFCNMKLIDQCAIEETLTVPLATQGIRVYLCGLLVFAR